MSETTEQVTKGEGYAVANLSDLGEGRASARSARSWA